jgi:hypothetical protein
MAMLTAKLSKTKQWEIDHPDDRPCPAGPTAARAWRIARGINKAGSYRDQQLWKKYDLALADKWAAQKEQQT